jgi:Tol biopolymer transport system component
VYERSNIDSNVYEAAEGASPVLRCPSTHPDLFPRFSPDGSRLAFISTRSGSRAVWLCSPDGPGQLTFHPNTFVTAPRWSADGLRLTYTAFLDGQAEVYVLDRLGAEPRRLTEATSNEVYPSWSADGRWIYYGSDRSGRMEVWRQPVGGGAAEQVTTDGGFIALAAPDGQTLYFTREGQSGLWQMPAGGGAATEVLGDFDLFTATSWEMLPDGFCFIDRSDPLHVRVMHYTFDGRERKVLRDLGRVSLTSGLSVTSDGRRVAYAQVDRQESDFMLVDNPEETIYR